MKKYKETDSNDIEFFKNLLNERVLYGETLNADYARDEMLEYGQFMPEAVLQVKSTDEVSQIMRYCNEKHIPVTPRGTGTGLCGGCVPIHGGIVLSLEKMNRVLEVDTKNMTATVEPGLLLIDFPKYLEGTGLFYPPDPGEKTATIGGNAMTNAGGMKAVRFGVTRDYILGLEMVLPDGEIITFGGKTVKTSSGYPLMQLMIGSEGTLGVLTKLIVKLVPVPKENITLLIPFDNLAECINSVPAVLASGCNPTAVEFMEKEVIKSAEQYLGKQFPDSSANAYLLVRLDAESQDALSHLVKILTDTLLELGANDVLMADTDERKESVWNPRGAFLEAINNSTPKMDECDVVVPRDRIAEFMQKSIEIGKENNIRLCSFGHAGDGNLHIYVCKDSLSDEEWKQKNANVMRELYNEAHRLGGEVSGEHGIGHAKRQFLLESVGPRQMELMLGIKKVFDKNNILNPGKVVIA
ncbi:MAG: FAD-binding oxidoreductase [Christensenellales bacterium]|jgi:glycolate oxidase